MQHVCRAERTKGQVAAIGAHALQEAHAAHGLVRPHACPSIWQEGFRLPPSCAVAVQQVRADKACGPCRRPGLLMNDKPT